MLKLNYSHYSAEQLKELYKFSHTPKENVSKSAPPKDPILGEILRGEKTKDWVLKYHQHDSLLEHRPEEQLSKERDNHSLISVLFFRNC